MDFARGDGSHSAHGKNASRHTISRAGISYGGRYPVAAKAAEFTSVTLAGGVTVEFAVVLPDGFTADKAWPAILAFPPGGQNKAMVNTGLGWWESEAQRRGYLVFSPAAPQANYFLTAAGA